MPPKSGSTHKNTSWKRSLDAPHPVLDPSGYPKFTVHDQAPEHQAEFAHFYPNGLPITYNMVHGHDSAGVAQEYIENHLPVRFYTHPPVHAMGKFSTMCGQSKQFCTTGDLLPERRVHLWTKDEIQSVCNSLRKIFWQEMKTLRRPTHWDDLWEYFDAVDLYHYGALNLWNVMNTLFDENCMISSVWRSELSLEIGHFTDEWVKDPGNQEKLKEWDDVKGPVLCCLTPDDWKKVSNLQGDEISLLKSALEYRRETLVSGNVQQGAKPPVDLMSAYQTDNLVNWLADTQVLGKNGLPPPPASAPYHGPQAAMSATAPCFMQQNTMYRSGNRAMSEGGQATGSSAVQALQMSAAAATTRRVGKRGDVVVAVGSSQLPPDGEVTAEKALHDPAKKAKDVLDDAPKESEPAAQKVLDDSLKQSKMVAEEDQPQKSESTTVVKTIPCQHEAPEMKSTDPVTGKIEPNVGPVAQAQKVATVPSQQPRSEFAGQKQVATLPEQTKLSNDKSDCKTEFRVEEERSDRQYSEGQVANEPLGQTTKLPRQKQRDGRAQARNNVPSNVVVSSPPYLDRPAFDTRPEMSRYGQSHTHDARMQTQGRLNSSGAGPRGGAAAPLPSRPPVPSGPQRNYTAPPSAQRGPRVESGGGPPVTSPRGGNWNGGRKGRGRGGGSYGQQRGEFHGGGDVFYDQQQAGGGWKDSWRRQHGSFNETAECRNDGRHGHVGYRPCSCVRCNERNRSVWVVVHERPEVHPSDVGARLRHGMGPRFGDVEAVLTVNCHDGVAFIVRFRNESSVPLALEFLSGLIPEKQLSLAISAVHGSKWVNSTWQNPMPVPHEQSRMPAVVSPGLSYPVNPYGMHHQHHPLADPGAASPSYPVFHGPGQMNMAVGVPPHLVGYNTSMMPPPVPPNRPQGSHGWDRAGSSRNSTASLEFSPKEILKPVRSQVFQPTVNEEVQSKPPSEEALGGATAIAFYDKSGSPDKQQHRDSKAHETRVSLPTTMFEHGSQGKKAEMEMAVTTGAVADYSMPPPQPVGEAPQPCVAETTKQAEEGGKQLKNEKQVNKDEEVAVEQHKEPVVAEDKEPAEDLADEVKVQSKAEKQRKPSIFTEEEIEGRLRAWDRIPMPLDPLKAKKTASSSTEGAVPDREETESANKKSGHGGQKNLEIRTAETEAATRQDAKLGQTGTNSPEKNKGVKSGDGADGHFRRGGRQGQASTRRGDENTEAGAGSQAGGKQSTQTGQSHDNSNRESMNMKKSKKKKNKLSRGTLPALWTPPSTGEATTAATPASPHRTDQAEELPLGEGQQKPTMASESKGTTTSRTPLRKGKDKGPSSGGKGYRADSGGSLRQDKKRRNRGNNAEGLESSSNAVAEQQMEGEEGRGGYGRGGACKPRLNPCATTFGALDGQGKVTEGGRVIGRE
ncbi:hypothetical protein XA68_10591 [Ophiocordyceps unilateralis]|uniref:Uncharacterized protein n=1 Tax=Ophiocordyceps unilateralis TaxID=268505 RepID=A0A2A9PHY0_OPHUN|nr:hypothetical protein XA68_10591 [Ophiocordyceps unilateralis]